MSTSSPRLLSLDAFRGFTIASMMLVNNPGDWGHLYAQLEHAPWSGWTFTDWVFPFFLFIGGVSMHFSLTQRAAAGADKRALLRQLLKRAGWIFLIGFLLNLVPGFHFDRVRIPGVLQRIALCIACAAPLAVYAGWRLQCAWIIALLALYSLVMLLVPVPDWQGVVAAGVLEPGRDAGAWLDRMLLGGHLWVQSKTWDPEGLLSTLPAIASVLLGLLAGRWLTQAREPAEKTVWLLLAGLACLLAGQILDGLLMPINKSLWTPSFCIFMTGWALIMFSCFYWLLDAAPSAALRRTMQKLTLPLVIYGMNALFLFALSGMFGKMAGWIHLPQADGSQPSLHAVLYAPIKALPLAPVNASLLFAILFNLVMWSIAWGMWKKRWFVKV